MFRPHREVSSTLGISAAIHLAVFLVFGSALYESGEDDRDVPELSVQLVTREGPNQEEFTEAALPKPAPEPVEDVLDDPGTTQNTIDAAMLANATPLQERAPDAEPAERREAQAESPVESGAILTTTAPAEDVVAIAPEPDKPRAEMPQPEQTMLTRNVQQLAQKLLDTNMTDTELTWQENGKQYSARVMRQPAPDSTGIEQVIAEVMTDKDGKRMKTRLSLKRLAFSHFTQLVNNWDRNIALHDDVIDGRFHSNSEFAFTATKNAAPRFFGKVTTAANTLTFNENSFDRRRNKDVFQGGFETRTERVVLPREMPDVLNDGDSKNRRVFTEDTRIIFNADGTYAWRNANGEGSLQRAEASQQAHYLIGEKGAKLYVRGTVNGLFTVYTPNDIEIEDDLVYARDPRQSMTSRDFLALIAGRDVCVGSPQVTGPGDLTVHAAVYARRRFYIELTERGRSGEATFVLYGSLTAGSISETEPRYATKIDFDKRFEYLRPASFPMTRRYEVESWDPDWEEVENPDAATGNLAHSQ